MDRMLWVRRCPSAPFSCVHLECTTLFRVLCPLVFVSSRSTFGRGVAGRSHTDIVDMVIKGGSTLVLDVLRISPEEVCVEYVIA